MTSGQFHTIPIDSIIVDREGRQRREPKGIETLADSIKRLGLIHPLVVTREHHLVAGERRWLAHRHLGLETVAVHYTDELDPAALRAIELEENVKRVDLPWQDQCRAIAEYHDLRKAEAEDWTSEKTAEALGLSRREVEEKIQVVRELINPKIAQAEKFSTARGIVRRTNERRETEAAEELLSMIGGGKAPEPKSDLVLNADFCEWAPTYFGPKFNFLHCDFPYGINTDKRKQGTAIDIRGGYGDTKDLYFDLLDCLVRSMDRLCSDSAHLIFWFSMTYYEETFKILDQQTPFVIDPFPLIWHKSDNAGMLPDPERGPRRTYETAFFGRRGDRKIIQPVANSFSGPTGTSHASEKPAAMLHHFFRMIVDEHTRMLDPTCGGASALRTAQLLRAKSVLGLEINPEFARLAALSLPKEH